MEQSVEHKTVNLELALTVLARSVEACEALHNNSSDDVSDAAVAMLKSGELTGTLGDSVYNFFLDEILNESRIAWNGCIYNRDEEENPDYWFGVNISEYQGIYFVQSVDYESTGYFLSIGDAMSFIEDNWDAVREEKFE